MKKRLLSLLLMAVLMMTALSGCAGGTDKSSEDNSLAGGNVSAEAGGNTTPAGEPTYVCSVVVGIQ